MNNLTSFVSLMQDLIILFDEGISIEAEKLHIVQKKRVTMLDDCMKKEQAFILKLKGLDKIREELQKDLGYGTMSFQEILQPSSKEHYPILEPLFTTLKEKVSLFQEISHNSETLIKLYLHEIDLYVNNANNNIHLGSTPQKTNFTSRTI